MNNLYSYVYWGDNKSTRVRFYDKPLSKNKFNLVTSCMCAAFDNNGNILLVKPGRGWGLPGGHVEAQERPDECIKRECLEEANVTLSGLKIIGFWEAKKTKQMPENDKYPDVGYQLLFLANIDTIGDFNNSHETVNRILAPIGEVQKYHHNYNDFKFILDYIVKSHETIS